MNNALINTMVSLKGATICTIDAVTIPTMRKTNNPYVGRVLKYVRTQMQFGYNYENAVNNRLEKMGLERSFKTSERKWGEWVIPNKVATNKGKFYLRFYTMESNTPTEVYYLVDGRLATREEVEAIKSFMPTPSTSNTQASEGLNEHQVQPREYEVESIRRVRVNGVDIFADKVVEIGA